MSGIAHDEAGRRIDRDGVLLKEKKGQQCRSREYIHIIELIFWGCGKGKGREKKKLETWR